jgi:aryl-alcohol dehydrogenase-like predicted oxidoreductase
MRSRQLGRSGLEVSAIGLGCMGMSFGYGPPKERGEMIALLRAAVERGVTFFDTAEVYGPFTNEDLVGEALQPFRDRVVIATKFGFNAQPGNPNAGGNGRKNTLRAVEGSLKRLGTDYIDLYLLHAWDRITPVEEVMRTLDDLVRSGKVRHVGFSDVPAWYAAKGATLAQLRGREAPVALQLEYSLVERNIEREFVDLGAEGGMGLMVWSPLASGLLSGKYRPSEGGGGVATAGEGRLETLKGSTNPGFAKFSERNFRIVAALEQVAKEVNRSMAQVALNWVAHRPGVASVIVGATKPAQLADNLSALDFTLPAELAQRLEDASRPERQFPYTFFEGEIQGMVHGGVPVGDKPAGYRAG